MTTKNLLLLFVPTILIGQGAGVNPAELLKPLKDSWPTYNGDYSGKRYSALKQIDKSTVKNLTLAWMSRVTPGAGNPGTGGRGGSVPKIIIGDNGPSSFFYTGGSIKGSVLQVDGTLYFSTPDNAWAMDALDGRELWHYVWKTKGGTHIANRGLGIWNNFLYMETPDNYLVSLDARTGKERWHKEIADVRQQYFCTPAPIIVGRHVIVGIGGDSLDVPGYLESREPETGELQWRWYTTPQTMGAPGSETWPDEYSMTHGGGMTWLPPTYDPELNLLYLPTGNPNPVFVLIQPNVKSHL